VRNGPEVTKRRPWHSPRISPRFLSLIYIKSPEEENRLLSNINTSPKIIAPARPFIVKEVRAAIRALNSEKTLDYD